MSRKNQHINALKYEARVTRTELINYYGEENHDLLALLDLIERATPDRSPRYYQSLTEELDSFLGEMWGEEDEYEGRYLPYWSFEDDPSDV